MRFPFCGASYTSQSAWVDGQRTVNWYPELTESGTATARVVLYPTPGFEAFSTLPKSPIRAVYTSTGASTQPTNERMFAVAGDGFYEVLSDGSYSYLGFVNDGGKGEGGTSGDPATISGSGDAGHQLWITGGNNGYIYDYLSGPMSGSIRTDTQFGGFLDGYFLSLDATTSKLYISALENGLSWDASDVAQRNTTADRWVSMLVSHREVWLFGRQRTDVWYNSGASPFPLEPIPGTLIEHGIAAESSAVTADNTVFWLGQNEQGTCVVWRAQGYTPIRVSNHAIEYAMQGYGTVKDAIAFAYQDQGHTFYTLTFPTAGKTWVYDIATGMWHERGHWNATTEAFEAWDPRYHCFAFGKHLAGSGTSGAIYDMAINHYTDADGSPIRRMRQAPHLVNEHGWMFYSGAEALVDVGIGTSSIKDPLIGLQWSDDAGTTWSDIHRVSAGRAGAYATRCLWRRLGRSRDRIFRLVVDDGVPWRVRDLLIQTEPGTS